MNQRIRELVGQAKFMAEETINKQISKNEELDAFAEKFAELIVRECIVDFYRNYLDTTSDEDITEQVDRYIKEHFGVGE